MKVYIGPYTNWIGPYQIAEKILFWMDKDDDERVHKFGEFLAHGFHKKTEEQSKRWFGGDDRPITLLYKACNWIQSKKKQKVKIHIDRWDTWNMDSTLSPIILPMLKQLKATKHGSAQVDAEDVPEELRIKGHEDWSQQLQFEFDDHEEYKTNSWDITHRRWDWVMDEMIWTFEQLQPDYDWEEQYASGVSDHYSEPCKWDENGKPTLYQMMDGPNHTYEVDWESRNKHDERISNGLRLFGKYYRGLWD